MSAISISRLFPVQWVFVRAEHSSVRFERHGQPADETKHARDAETHTENDRRGNTKGCNDKKDALVFACLSDFCNRFRDQNVRHHIWQNIGARSSSGCARIQRIPSAAFFTGRAAVISLVQSLLVAQPSRTSVHKRSAKNADDALPRAIHVFESPRLPVIRILLGLSTVRT